MSSDRARISYDPTRQYRSVVAQQGRVTLEADVNEAQEIAGERLRAETIDVIGPSGTPDDGYKIAAVPGDTTRDFSVGAGTMYVGGERVTLPAAVKYTTQTEWLDRAGDPLWADAPQAGTVSEFVYLFLREQEVSAVEDNALREVALGGPDTAQRKRLIQRIVRLPVDADTCVTALEAAQASWSAAGANFDAATMMLTSPATLKVALVNQPTPATPCEPQAQGGYIGSDNQLIRVQISHCDANKTSGRLLWSRDNASFLHRLKPVDPANPTVLELMTTPVDAYHAPRANHPVEVLRSALQLSVDPAIDPLNRDYVAAHGGVIATPAQDYQPDLHRLVLPAALPAAYLGGAAPLFLRLWEEELPFTSGTPVTLTGTGLQVVIDLHSSAGSFTVGQFWMFAARPNTPAEVYAHRYLFAPQPPEGPRLWACPLATIGWGEQTFKLLDDCRNPFDNLVELTKRHDGCCGVVVTPAEVAGGAGLQDLLDKLAGQKATVSLMPGIYELPKPLMLSDKHSDLTLEGCHDGAVLTAQPGAEDAFVPGLVELVHVNDFTLRRLRFHMPLAKAPVTNGVAPLATSIGVLAVHCADLRIEECLFRFRLTTDIDLYAAGVFATSECWNHSIERNRFLHDDEYKRDAPLKRIMVGVLVNPGFPLSEMVRSGRNLAANNKVDAVAALLDNARITRNEFAGLTMAVYARAELGRVFCDDNLVHGCDGGFYFATTDLAFARESLLQSFRAAYRNDAEEKAFTYTLQATQAPQHLAMHDFATRIPLPARFEPPYTLKVGKSPTAAMARATTAQAKSGYAQLLAALSGAKAGADDEATAVAANETSERVSTTMKTTLTSYLAALPAERADRLVPRLRFMGNDVEILPLTDDDKPKDLTAVQSLALYVALPPGMNTSIAATANSLRGSAMRRFIAVIRQPTVATFTGNMVLNNARDARMSLWLEADAKGPLMNASGNTLQGKPEIIPANPPAAGCAAAAWDHLNSMRG